MSDDPIGLPGPPILFLDLDGTVRKGYDDLGRWVNGPDDVELYPEAVAAMTRWRTNGGRIIGITNQAGVALGHMTEQQCRAAIAYTDTLTGGLFDRILACTHAPSVGCWCRKPMPGHLVLGATWAAAEFGETSRGACLMVGDRPEDAVAAAAAGVEFQWATEWRASAEATS